ncbi:FAD-binding oxidoreductase [Streptomyces sp. WI04-05B]|uniref:FAD-binding oxidoreductase n=1 Tax=Streptomyces TaxID=1883 RepID=UPI0029A6B79A|nr:MULTISPECIES: FAD-linked oxidase C-terminal domain-containing protein [unclassified Streptomyces]MDX2545788.1 FAD-linked oxidase C-terminal domain-containing protein [Streptomyces sp. WI04-05B]MDX2583519.1 FAD-linked oxidase C-terminal domain-containing protein [Streptomyces sp. WI04-05A]MDX3745287.1 FAD-linked oxidase C-terminal domain-containing protein [Streptomyces sp. AK08-02]
MTAPTTTASAQFLGLLARDLPPDRLATDPVTRAAHATDRSGTRAYGGPLAVVHARRTEDVTVTLRHAHALRVPVVPRGAGTGLSGGASAGEGTLVLDLSGMDRVLELSVDDQLAVVEPGVVTAELDRAAGAHGLRYAPDPASAALSTIGGNIATNAGGLRCAKYGVTRDSVLGLEAVLADGTVVRTGRRTVKGVTGYDLTALLTGSEGTLAVITSATLRLRPLPVSTATLAAYFPSFEAAAEASYAIGRAGVVPALAELVDGPVLHAVDPALRERGAALLLVQCDGAGAGAEAAAVAEVLAGAGATSVERTEDPAEAEALLAVRRGALPALERLGRPLIEDIAVPRSRLAEAAREIRAVSRRHDVPVFTIAHAADGNLHPIIVVDPALDGLPDAAWEAAGEIFALALRLGGTLTGEHGVGVLKRQWVADELGPASHALQRRIKDAFDPRGILNPGKSL